MIKRIISLIGYSLVKEDELKQLEDAKKKLYKEVRTMVLEPDSTDAMIIEQRVLAAKEIKNCIVEELLCKVQELPNPADRFINKDNSVNA